MEKIPAYISLGILLIIVMLLVFNLKRIKQQYRYFIMYCCFVFLYEVIMFVTASFRINNHFVLNLNTLFYNSLALIVLANVYKQYHKRNWKVKNVLMVLICLFTVYWCIDNFLFGNSIWIFNSKVSAVSSVLTGLAGIFLVNLLFMIKSNHILKDPDVLIVSGILMRAITFGFTLWFLNFDLGFDADLIGKLLIGINVGLCISDLFFLYAVRHMIVFKKYREPLIIGDQNG